MFGVRRVRVLYRSEDEPELYGMEGVCNMSVGDDGRVVVFLDNDKLPTRFWPSEVEVIE